MRGRKVLNYVPDNEKRPRGRPTTRWTDEMRKQIGINQRRETENRNPWGKCGEAYAQKWAAKRENDGDAAQNYAATVHRNGCSCCLYTLIHSTVQINLKNKIGTPDLWTIKTKFSSQGLNCKVSVKITRIQLKEKIVLYEIEGRENLASFPSHRENSGI